MAGRLRRLLPPLALFAGLLLFGISLLVIGIEASGTDPQPLQPSAFISENGTAALAYPTKYFGLRGDHVEVSYAFPSAPGDALVVDCEGYRAVLTGEPVTPLLAFTGLQEGRFDVTHQTLPSGAHYAIVVDPQTGARTFCEPVVVFRWDVAGGDATANRPTVDVTFHQGAFDMERSSVLLVILTASSLLALLGGIAWARQRAKEPAPPGASSALEVLRASLDRLGEQLQRTRQHLLLAGVFGVFLWYPVLVPWAWRQASRTEVSGVFPWAVAGLTFAFLAVVTWLWARELHRLDREILAWRSRLGQLREREDSLLDTFEQGR
jgi:hypothetical protein